MRVHSCGICGSDIHQLRDGWGFTPGRVAGHEWTGTIAAVGDSVTGWSVGELVVGRHRPHSAVPAGVAVRASRRSARTATPWPATTATGPSPSTSSPGPPACYAARRALGSPCRAGRAALGGAARHHPVGVVAGRHGDGLRRRAHRGAERRRTAGQGYRGRHGRGTASEGRRRLAERARGDRRSWTLPSSRCSPRGSRTGSPSEPRTSSSSARAIVPPLRPRSASCGEAARW